MVRGDAIAIMMLPEEIRAQLAFAFSPKKAIYNPITGFVNKGIELEESVYLLTYKLMGVLPNNDNRVLVDKRFVKENKLMIDNRFDYGKLSR